MALGNMLGEALDEKRTKPRVGMTIIYFIDGPTDGRTAAAKVVRVIDRDVVELELCGPREPGMTELSARRSPHVSRVSRERYTATYAGASSAPRPAGSWDFIV